MATTKASGKIAVVTGDVTIDWNLAHAQSVEGAGAAWNAEATEGYVAPGGAALLGELIETVSARMRGVRETFDVRRVPLPDEALRPRAPGLHHSYVFWSRFKETQSGGPDAWRVKEFLGLDRPASEPDEKRDLRAVGQDPAKADVVVLDDAGLGFRDDEGRWPKAITGRTLKTPPERKPWVILKMAQPVAEGSLWEHLLEHFADRLVVVVTANDLRLTEARISRELSWERTAADLADELVSNPRINSLSHCTHVVVSLNTDGALLLSRRRSPGRPEGTERRPAFRLFFDPQMIEGMWSEEHPGRMVGYTACLTAGIALQLMRASDGTEHRVRKAIERGIQRGLVAMRALHVRGYGGASNDSAARADLRFPGKDVADELIAAGEPFAQADVPPDPSAEWTILEARHPEGLEQIAPAVALKGAEAVLNKVPLGRFGKLVTVDRQEIEGFQSIRALIREYACWEQSRPLSIAVFGPPGSGKSFGVVQVAKSLSGEFEKLEFNLSQLRDPTALHGAFHRVRDVGLGGGIPLVFWDEFDTDQLGWLRHFLVPMQDGTFQEGETLHPIGRAIFVFAGGTSYRMADFSAAANEAKLLKGPDFLSRLKGYVDIIGPNPRGDDPEKDPYHLIRRAILLRSMLLRDRKGLFEQKPGADGKDLDELEIDSGVLRAFLRAREYKHGARSMESIVAMSTLHGKTRFERSSLPAREQLAMHVDADDFLDLAERHEPEEEMLETLAEATHVLYCRRMLGDGYRWGEDSLDYLKKHEPLRMFASRARRGKKRHSTLVPYDKLREDDKEQNRAQVRNIPSQLEALGYVMRKARGDGAGSGSFAPDPEAIEALAEKEHDRWLREKLDAKWRWAPKRDNRRKHHPDMVPWRELTARERTKRFGKAADRVGPGELEEKDRKKDRDIAQATGDIAAAAGYEIVKVED